MLRGVLGGYTTIRKAHPKSWIHCGSSTSALNSPEIFKHLRVFARTQIDLQSALGEVEGASVETAPREPAGRRASDEDVMRQVQENQDAGAFGCLYDRHAARAYRVAVSICGDSSRAEEAVQEGFLAIWRGRARFRAGSGSFQAWSMAIVRYAAIDRLRYDTAVTRPRLCEEAVEAADPRAKSVESRVMGRSDADALHSMLAQLPPAQAKVIGLAFFGELSHAEIAHRLNLPPGTVKGRIRLGLEKLRSQIG